MSTLEGIGIKFTYIPLTLYPQRPEALFSETPTFYQNYLAMRNTADVTSGKLIAVGSQSISGVSAINPLVTFYDIHGRKREMQLFSPGHHTRSLRS
jgi:hypothetical protein